MRIAAATRFAGLTLTVASLGVLVTTALFAGTSHVAVPARLLSVGSACVVISMLLGVGTTTTVSSPWYVLARNSLATAVAALCAGVICTAGSPPWEQIAQLAAAIFVLMLALSSAQHLAAKHSPIAGPFFVVLIVLVAALTPIWSAPLVERYANSHTLINSAVALSPLSYIASAVDYDYLLSAWFYTNTPFGGLRYHYPGIGIMTALYLGSTAAMVALLTTRTRKFTQPIFSSLANSSQSKGA